MKENIPRALSGPGSDILEKIHLPLLEVSENFDRVSSFFSTKALANSITEIATMWKAGGKIRLILSPIDSSDIHQALDNLRDEPDKIVKIVNDRIEDAVRKIKGTKPEVIEALETMLWDNLLQVAIVVPKSGRGLFHSKFSVYHLHPEYGKPVEEEISRYVVVHGSFNETGAGYGENIEDASSHRSWVSSEYEVARVFRLRFDELWNDFAPDSISIPITGALKKALEITHSPKDSGAKALSVGEYLGLTAKIPHSVGYSRAVWLMAHQASVVNSATSFNPVRAMLCDEVGLGKTIQAGAILSRLMAEKTCQKTMIIAPASTLTQWAIEISSKFEHPVSLYRKNHRERFLEGELYDKSSFINYAGNPSEMIDNCQISILSSQWFRLRNAEFVEELSSHFDLLILDEAHHARLLNLEKRQGRKLWASIKIASEIIPNVLLLTATPFQTGNNDYLGLLDILRTVDENDLEDIRIGTGIVSGELPWNRSQKAALIRSIDRKSNLLKNLLDPGLMYSIEEAEKPLSLASIAKIIENNTIDEKLLYSTLPTTLFTYRNTRNMLREIGFGFPNVIFETIKVDPGEYTDALKSSHTFIMKYLGGSEGISGLTRSLYYQRAVSSIDALFATLNNRLNDVFDTEIEEADYDLVFERMRPAAAIEIERIDNLLSIIDEVRVQSPDPKIERLKSLILELTEHGRRILIFSRYTDTTDPIESEMWSHFPDLTIGRYDGEHTRIRQAGESVVEDVTKDVLIRKLAESRIDVIVCSDAASEGLNLQSASAVINVDVPWNPARVLQRIGRVDRLGQTSETVVIYNLVYFDTIEERMYRVLDDRQTEAIRYLGEFPQLLSTEESRHQFQVFGVPIEDRVDKVQAETREGVVMQRLLRERENLDSNLNAWMKALIEKHPDTETSENPADHYFAMRNNTILKSDTGLSSITDAVLGFAVSDDGVKHALLLSCEAGFISVTPSLLWRIISDSEIFLTNYEDSTGEYLDIDEAVQAYIQEFSSISSHLRSPGLMSDKFHQEISLPKIKFEPIY